MTTITCIDKNNNSNNFKYSYSIDEDFEGRKQWKFMVFPEGGTSKDFFSFKAEEVNGTTLKVTVMNHHNQKEYIAKGIPEKIVEELARLSEKTIVSSSNNDNYKSFDAEYRTPPATKFWVRLVGNGLAKYDEKIDIYIYTG